MPEREDVKPAVPGVRLTYQDYVLIPDDGKRHELIDGEHYVIPAPVRKHQAAVGNVHALIWNYLQQRPIGRVISNSSMTAL